MKIEQDQIKLVEFNDHIGTNYFHFKASCLMFGRIITGFGSSLNKHLAAQKAIFELIERSYFFDEFGCVKDSSSSGFAAHISAEQAINNAYLELLERHFFLTSWIDKKNPLWFNNEILNKNSPISFLSVSSFCKKNNLNLKIGTTYTDKTICCLVGAVYDPQKRFGGFIVSAASNTISDCLEKIASNISRQLTIIVNRSKHFTSLIRFDKPTFTSTSDHFEYYLNPSNFDKILWFLSEDSNEKYNLPDDIRVALLEKKIKFPFTFEVCYATSPSVQKYFIGETTYEKLSQFLKVKANNNGNLNYEIHPLP